jgi:NADH:ubiquinone oxidoreductase subunit E
MKAKVVIFLTNFVKKITSSEGRLGGEVMTITVCIGSGCHVKGARHIIAEIQRLMEEHKGYVELELEACFCQGRCTEGVVVKFDEEIVTGVNRDNIRELFEKKVLGAEVNEHNRN